MERYGIACAGNWVVDRVKVIDQWPAQDTLATIHAESRGGGGGAYNVSVDLSRLGAPFPLTAVGCVGDDADGQFVRDELDVCGIDPTWLRTCPGLFTSYTDVMQVAENGRRTFFHHWGANAALRPEHFPFEELTARWVHLAYLLLLPGLDAPDAAEGSVGAGVLRRLRAAGLHTSLDVVSSLGPRAREVVLPALPHVDALIINELEAGALSGVAMPDNDAELDLGALSEAAERLLAAGVNDLVAIHLPAGGYLRRRDGGSWFQPSLDLPAEFVQGTVGAGDAFAAGLLFALHEGWSPEKGLELAVATAAGCLRAPTCTAGVGPVAEMLGLIEAYPPRQPVAR